MKKILTKKQRQEGLTKKARRYKARQEARWQHQTYGFKVENTLLSFFLMKNFDIKERDLKITRNIGGYVTITIKHCPWHLQKRWVGEIKFIVSQHAEDFKLRYRKQFNVHDDIYKLKVKFLPKLKLFVT